VQRLFHFALLGIVGVSLASQTLRFYADMSGHAGGWLQQVVELSGLFIALGTVAAFFKLLVNLMRSVRQREARVLALTYGIVLAWPLFLGVVNITSNVASQVQTVELPSDRHSPVRVLQQRLPEVPPSREFLAGEAWARQQGLSRSGDCRGSTTFHRGCVTRVLQAQAEQEAVGRAWAEQSHPSRISQCQGDTARVALGCLKWLHEQPGAPGAWPFGATTTAACRIEVNANYEVSQRLDLDAGNPRGAESTRRRRWLPDLLQCDLIDRQVQEPMMALAYGRLDTLLRRIREGERPTQADDAVFRRDYTEISKLPDQPYKERYLQLAADYLERRASAVEDPPPHR
jgi:hypothetical protein